MMKKKNKKSVLPKSKKPQGAGRVKHGKSSGGQQKGKGRQQQKQQQQRRPAAEGGDDELQQRQQRVEELRRSLGMPARGGHGDDDDRRPGHGERAWCLRGIGRGGVYWVRTYCVG